MTEKNRMCVGGVDSVSSIPTAFEVTDNMKRLMPLEELLERSKSQEKTVLHEGP